MEKDDGSITTSSCTSSDRSAIGVHLLDIGYRASAIIASASVATRIGIVSIEAGGESGLSRVVLPRIDMETLKNLPHKPTDPSFVHRCQCYACANRHRFPPCVIIPQFSR